MKDARPQHYNQNRFRKHVAASSVVDPLCGAIGRTGPNRRDPCSSAPEPRPGQKDKETPKSSKLEHMFTFAIHFTNIDLLSSNVKESLKKKRGGVKET